MSKAIDTQQVVKEAIELLDDPAESINEAMQKVAKRTQNKILTELIEEIEAKKIEKKASDRVNRRLIALIP